MILSFNFKDSLYAFNQSIKLGITSFLHIHLGNLLNCKSDSFAEPGCDRNWNACSSEEIAVVVEEEGDLESIVVVDFEERI